MEISKKALVEYKVNCLLNELGCYSFDYSNDENNKKVDEVKEMILKLTETLPKVEK